MKTIEETAQWATENRHNEHVTDGEFYDNILNFIGDLIDDNNAENWEQNESNQQ